MECKICTSAMEPWFVVPGDWRKPERDVSFAIERCPSDGFACVAPIPPPEVIADHYRIGGYYTQDETTAETPQPACLLFRAMQKIAALADRSIEDFSVLIDREASSREIRILDIGAGSGNMMRRLQDMGFDVLGVEPDPAAMSRRPDFPMTVLDGTAEVLPPGLGAGSFDAIICSHVLEHTTDPILALANIHDLLKPGGTVFIEVPNADCLDFRLSRLNWQHLDVPRHLSFWGSGCLPLALERAGFGLVDLGYRYYARQLSWNWARFGLPMIDYYRRRAGYTVSVKGFTHAYYLTLLALTLLAPARRKYDSLCAIARKV